MGNHYALSEEEKNKIIVAATKSVAVDLEATRLCEPVYMLKAGKPRDAALGLLDRMDVNHSIFYGLVAKGVEGIEEELKLFAMTLQFNESALVNELLKYVLYDVASEKKYPNGIRDLGRSGVRFEYFCTHPYAIEAGLQKPEVLALRLYTTALYKYFNDPLRDDDRHDKRITCPLAVTTHFAVEGIKKLRTLNIRRLSARNLDLESTSGSWQQRFPIIYWRGMRNREIATGFREEGGTELGFMSTSANPQVAVNYSLGRQSLLLKIVARTFLSTGADLKWISAFPAEAEIVFPPLTFLNPTGRTDEVIVERGSEKLIFNIVEVETSLG
jgi:hypothetical protein